MQKGTAQGVMAALSAARAASRDGAVWLSHDGEFEDVSFFGVVGRPVVIDANWLRNDLLWSCRNERPTIMLHAANQGAIRLFAASHVLAEVVRHHEEWAASRDLPADRVLEWWKRHYLPVLRLVDPPDGLLDVDEQQHIDRLDQLDSDDVPTATLAVLLQAPLISSDRRALAGVYGPGSLRREQSDLRDLLRDSSNDTALKQSAATAAFLPVAVGGVLVPAAARGAARHPFLALAAGALLAAGASRVKPATWRRSASRVGRALGGVVEVLEVQQQWQRHVQDAAPPPPQWDAIGDTVPASAVRARALMHTMAHRLGGQTTLDELAGVLPALPVATSPRLLGEALRKHEGPVFQRFGSAMWQLGQTTSSPDHRRPRTVDAEGQYGDI
jgi:predicted nucleic acid-binding protein